MIDRFNLFVSSITEIYRAIHKIKIYEMSELGLKGNHVMCLFYLQQYKEGLTSTQLAKHCGEDKAAVSRALKELKEHELIQYEDLPGQRRYRSIITLTDKGTAITAKMYEKITKSVGLAAQGYSEEERRIFYDVLVRVTDNLRATVEKEENLNAVI